MKLATNLLPNWHKRILKTATVACLLCALFIGIGGAWWDTGGTSSARKGQLAKGNAISDPQALLRYALPIDNPQIRKLQASVEDIAIQLRGKRWGQIGRDVKEARSVVTYDVEQILASISEPKQPQAEKSLAQIQDSLDKLQTALEAKDKEQIYLERSEILAAVTQLEEMMVQGFPFTVPAKYDDLPQLKGRATVVMETSKGDLTIVVDGYSAPVNAGNFVDLVERDFYNGLEFIPGQDYVLQTGDPPGEEEGFIAPSTGEYRAIPLEVQVRGESEPIYEVTLEDYGLYLADVTLPFAAYGTVALARPGDDPNGGSSQVFFFLFDNELTPPGFNVLDGRYSVFGYVVEGKEVLEKLQPGDQVISAQVVAGQGNLLQP